MYVGALEKAAYRSIKLLKCFKKAMLGFMTDSFIKKTFGKKSMGK